MRDLVHMGCLAAIFAFLATRFPSAIPDGASADVASQPFAAFVELSPEAHAAYLAAARTSWQVRSETRWKPSVGRLDAGVPLLADALPAPALEVVRCEAPQGPDLQPRDVREYVFIPQTEGADVPAFSIKTQHAESDYPIEEPVRRPAFGREDMLSTDNSRTIKELMQ